MGDQIILSTKHLPLVIPKPPKYLPKFLGPFRILQVINRNAYDLPPTFKRLHNVFNITFIEPYVASSSTSSDTIPIVHGNIEHIIENILGHKRYKKNYKNFVQYQGDSPNQAIKEPVSQLVSDNNIISNKLQDYLTTHNLIQDFNTFYPQYKLN